MLVDVLTLCPSGLLHSPPLVLSPARATACPNRNSTSTRLFTRLCEIRRPLRLTLPETNAVPFGWSGLVECLYRAIQVGREACVLKGTPLGCPVRHDGGNFPRPSDRYGPRARPSTITEPTTTSARRVSRRCARGRFDHWGPRRAGQHRERGETE